MNRKSGKICWLCIAWMLLLAVPSQAVKLFAVELNYSSGAGSQYLLVENSSLPDLIEDLVNSQGPFSDLGSVNSFTGKVRYFGLPDAFQLEF